MNPSEMQCEYVVVGSGAAGGTLAARLAEAGKHVVLLEAGSDACQISGGDPAVTGYNRLPADYEVPAFHAFSSENEALRWDFFVRHYEDERLQLRDPKYVKAPNGTPGKGILYPRAGTLGGCTAHNAMIFVYPHDSDWDYIAGLTGDASWAAKNMRRYLEVLENCHHRPWYRALSKFGVNPTRHGWNGWLHTERALPIAVLRNKALAETLLESAVRAFEEDGHQIQRTRWALESGLDPNDWRLTRSNSFGLHYTPLTTCNHARIGTRERVRDVSRRFPDRLQIILNALVTRIKFDERNRATGVEYLEGKNLYRAHGRVSRDPGQPRVIRASREVILSGGAFNTPQLLMLSGVGPASGLERYGIPVRNPLEGVGKNLQDRYEISVVNRMNFKAWELYDGATFTTADPQFSDWQQRRAGVYTTNGSLLTVFRHSPQSGSVPDLFCMSLLAPFRGYYPGYSRAIAEGLNYLTWVVLKAHTRNRAGEVTLRSADPRDTPLINFNFFKEGGEEDLKAVLDGIKFVRRVSQPLKNQGLIAEEELPGSDLTTDEELGDFVCANAWGHHASCSCPIGSRADGGVLTNDFRVYGTEALRVVDASVFPRIPGFFIASAIYMIGEKAADVILKSN